MARAGADDDSILAALRSEFCAGQSGGPRSIIMRPELERSFGRWVESGILDDTRIAGEIAIMEALQVVAETGEGREQTTAATQLLKYRQEDVTGEARRMLAKLKDATPEEWAAALRQQAEAIA